MSQENQPFTRRVLGGLTARRFIENGGHIFISYNRQDSSHFVDRLEADLTKNGFQVWVDRRGLEGGQQFDEVIEKAIKKCAIFFW